MKTKIIYADFRKECIACGNKGVNYFEPMEMCMPCITGESDRHDETQWKVIFDRKGHIKEMETIT